jgi:hypothetical protein
MGLMASTYAAMKGHSNEASIHCANGLVPTRSWNAIGVPVEWREALLGEVFRCAVRIVVVCCNSIHVEWFVRPNLVLLLADGAYYRSNGRCGYFGNDRYYYY